MESRHSCTTSTKLGLDAFSNQSFVSQSTENAVVIQLLRHCAEKRPSSYQPIVISSIPLHRNCPCKSSERHFHEY